LPLAEFQELVEELASTHRSAKLGISEDELRARQETVRRIDELHERLLATYGEMPDSVIFVRQDRER